ncbi:glycosyltransferase family 2 protein [Arenicella chitinivorans]
MSVYNEQDTLRATVDSVLNQEGVRFEFIIIDDGSTDASVNILKEIARLDPRIRILRQDNQGITKALIKGCRHAEGEFIARQDAGDISLPGRLKTQLSILRSQRGAVLCSTGTQYFSELGERLMEATISSHQANAGLRPNTLDDLIGPTHHGCVMFRKQAYFECGQYRAEFKVAQDLDLWTRMIELGLHVALPDMFYQAVLRPNAISSTHRDRQERARRLIFQCIKQRADLGTDASALQVVANELTKPFTATGQSATEYDYFIGSLLLQTGSKNCRAYFKRALVNRPFDLKVWFKLIKAYF